VGHHHVEEMELKVARADEAVRMKKELAEK